MVRFGRVIFGSGGGCGCSRHAGASSHPPSAAKASVPSTVRQPAPNLRSPRREVIRSPAEAAYKQVRIGDHGLCWWQIRPPRQSDYGALPRIRITWSPTQRMAAFLYPTGGHVCPDGHAPSGSRTNAWSFWGSRTPRAVGTRGRSPRGVRMILSRAIPRRTSMSRTARPRRYDSMKFDSGSRIRLAPVSTSTGLCQSFTFPTKLSRSATDFGVSRTLSCSKRRNHEGPEVTAGPGGCSGHGGAVSQAPSVATATATISARQSQSIPRERERPDTG